MNTCKKYAFRACERYKNTNDKTIVSGKCHVCALPVWVEVKTADLQQFQKGEYADRCFSYLSAGEREFLISGICDACWDALFLEQK